MADISTIILPNGEIYDIKDTTARESIPTAISELTNDSNFITNEDNAYRAVSIPMGQCDSTSTATVFTATVPGVTELRDGVCVYLKNGVITSASGWTLNINDLGAKPVYQTQAAASRVTTVFNVAYTGLFVYNSSRVEGGCWDYFYGYNSDTNTTAYQVRAYQTLNTMYAALTRYKICFTRFDGTILPATAVSNNTGTSKALTTESFDPYGLIYYYSTTTGVAAGESPGASYMWVQYPTVDLRYTFNTGTTLTAKESIYIKCSPQTDGSLKLAGDNCIVQALPNSADNYVYLYLGKAYDTYRMSLDICHPIYYYSGGAIRQWVNIPSIPTAVSSLTNDSGYQTASDVNGLIATAIGNINSFDVEVVNALPSTNIKDHTIYFVSKSGSDTGDVYDEYMYINNTWELIGTTAVDLSGYVPTSRTINNKALTSNITLDASDVGALPSNTVIPTVPTNVSSFTNDAGYLTSQTQSDWNENDSTASSFIQNRTHYTEDPAMTEVWSETITMDGVYYEAELADNSWCDNLEDGQPYSLMYNGVEYTGEVGYNDEDGIYYINDFDSEDPVLSFDGLWYYLALPEEASYTGTINLSLSLEIKIVHKLDSKYLNGRLITNGTGRYSEVFNNISVNTASGDYSHAEGFSTTASGYYSHAEGNGAIASDAASHAEGDYTTASGYSSHAEGVGTTASGYSSHAEGVDTTASGHYSHAEGNGATASGYYSHAEGSLTTANHRSQHVFGEFNISDSSSASNGSRGTYVEIVGNGTSTNNRSNAHTLDWSGNSWYAGKVSAGTVASPANPTAANDLTTKVYVDSAISGIVDTNTTYSLSISNNRITLTPSSGTASYIDLPVYNGGVT